MSLVKELLFSCIVMNICLVAPRPISPGKLCGLMHGIKFSFNNLKQAEDDYVKYIFNATGTTLEPIKGITLPVGNNTEILASMCAIADYFDNHLLEIVRHNTQDHAYELISSNITAFNNQFKHAVEESKEGSQNPSAEPVQCRMSVPSDGYDKKVTGFKIIHFTYKWVVNFTSTETCN